MLSVTNEGQWAVEAKTIPVNSEQEEFDEPFLLDPFVGDSQGIQLLSALNFYYGSKIPKTRKKLWESLKFP